MRNNITSQNLVFFQSIFMLIAGGAMLLIPSVLTDQFDAEKLAMVKWSGIQNCAIGGLSFAIYRSFGYREADRMVFLFMMGIHLISAFHIYQMEGLGLLKARWLYAAHFVFAFSFAIVYYLEKSNYHSDQKSDENVKNS